MKTRAINRLVYTFTIVTVLLYSVFNIVVYYFFSSAYIGQAGSANASLNELRSSMLNEKVFDSIERLLTESVVSDYWKDISFFVAGDWQNSLVRVKNTHTFLGSLQKRNDAVIESVSIYAAGPDAELSSLSGLTFIGQRSDYPSNAKKLYQHFSGNGVYSGWHYDTGTGVVSYSILYPLVGHVYHPQGIISVQLRGNAFRDIIGTSQKGAVYFLIDEDRNIVLQSYANDVYYQQALDMLRDGDFVFPAQTTFRYRNLNVNSALLSNRSWRLVHVVPSEAVYSDFIRVNIIVLVLYLCIVTAWTIFSFRSFRRLQRPIRSLLEYIENLGGVTPDKPMRGDAYQQLSDSIYSLSDQYISLQNTLADTKLIMRNDFMMNLIRNRALSQQQVRSLSRLCDVSLSFDRFGLLLISVPMNDFGLEPSYEDWELYTRLRLAVEGFSNRELQLYAAYSPHFLQGRFFGVVVNTQLSSAEAALCLDALDRQLAEHFGLPFLYAFGGVGRGLDYLQVSRRNAEIVMQYAFFVTDKALLSDPEFIRRCEQRPDSLDPRHIRRIEDALKSQNVPAAQAAVTHFFEQIRSQEHNARSVHQACRSLIRCFEQSVREASANSMIAVSVGEMLAGAQSARSLETMLLMEMDSLKEYRLEPGADPVGANKYRLVEQARDYVENNLTENISMASVSGALGVSAQYLSRIFKEVMSVNFIDFLIDKKLEKARLLFDQDRSITVEQAATRIGYSNASYFIRKFKEKYGVTPNAYKSGLDPQPDAEGPRPERC